MRYLFVLVILISFLSCGRDKKQNEIRTSFRYNESAGITSLDPAFARNQANIWGCNQVFNGLVQLNDNLEVEACIGAKADNIAGVGWHFRLIEDNIQHCGMMPLARANEK